jgi:hypothetical protein
MAGSISLSLSQQFDELGEPLGGGLLYFFAAGTTTPQSAYQDVALTLPYPNPIELDSAGRVPPFYLADGQIKIRLTNAAGVVQVAADNLLVIGASSGSGSPPSVDATTIFQTGDVMWLDVEGTRAGWVRDNGRTIGSATSGATERANADTEPLYSFLWSTYSNTICPVATGRGANAAADFAANKAIGLPNKQGMVPGGLDGMGATASSAWSDVNVESGSATTAGSVVGRKTKAISTENLPPQTPAGTNSGGAATFQFTTRSDAAGGGANTVVNNIVPTGGSTLVTAVSTQPTFTGTPFAGQVSEPLENVQRTVLGTFYRKL